MPSTTGPVLILHDALDDGARPDEIDSLIQAEQVAAALRRRGYTVAAAATDLDLQATLDAIASHEPACVFNLVESLGRDGRLVHVVPALLEAAGVRFTGSGGDAMYLSSQKLIAKSLLRANGIPTPLHFLAGGAPADGDCEWIVKSVWEHASFGMDDACVVTGTEAAERRLCHSRELHGGEWFAEEFIDGREFNVALAEVDGRMSMLPLAEMTFVDYPSGKPKIVGYAAKWDETAPEYHATQRSFAPLPQADYRAIREVAESCWRLFGLSGYARVDIRMDAECTPWVLEINANPCLSRDAGFAAAAAEAGLDFDELVKTIVRAAMA